MILLNHYMRVNATRTGPQNTWFDTLFTYLLLRYPRAARIFRRMSTQANHEPEAFGWTMGDRIRKSMHVAGMTAGTLAEAIGVTRVTVNRWVGDAIEPSLKTLRNISEATGAPLVWLITGHLNETPPPSDDGGGNVSLLSESNRRPFHYNFHTLGVAA